MSCEGGMNMRIRPVVWVLSAAVAAASFTVAFAPRAAAQAAGGALPDFTGIWQGDGAPEHRYTFSKDPPPMQPWAEQLFNYNRFSQDPNFRGRDELDPVKNCFPPGPTRLLFSPYPF